MGHKVSIQTNFLIEGCSTINTLLHFSKMLFNGKPLTIVFTVTVAKDMSKRRQVTFIVRELYHFEVHSFSSCKVKDNTYGSLLNFILYFQ
jgi:hypothetical protein